MPDSGATSHCMSSSCFRSMMCLELMIISPRSNASNETIEVVLKVCDVRVRFGKQVVFLEHCLLANWISTF